MKMQKHIFIAFFRSGILGFGGGPSAIPLMHKEVVKTYALMSDEEFSDMLAIANTLPGPIISKMAGYIGYRVGGILGLLNALIAAILPTAIAMILLLTVLSNYKNVAFIEGMTNGVVPIVGVMMLVLTMDFLKKGHKTLGLWRNILLLAISAVAIVWLGIHPAIIITIVLVLALVLPVKEASK